MIVRTSFGMMLAAGVTGPDGDVTFALPPFGGLCLDVLGTDAVDIPVSAGQAIEVWVN